MHTVMLGELSRTGEGERPAGEPMPHAVFSAQILPSSIKAAPQAAHERIPTTSEKDRELIAMLRAAARSAVREWRSRGVEPASAL